MIMRQEKAIFVDFRKMILQKSQKSISAIKKSFFSNLTMFRFELVECVLCIFKARCAYEKCLLESKQTFDITYSVIRPVQMILRQEKAIFVDFRKMILRKSQKPISAIKKSFFQNLTRFRFWLVECVLCIFKACCAYEKCLLKSK